MIGVWRFTGHVHASFDGEFRGPQKYVEQMRSLRGVNMRDLLKQVRGLQDTFAEESIA